MSKYAMVFFLFNKLWFFDHNKTLLLFIITNYIHYDRIPRTHAQLFDYKISSF